MRSVESFRLGESQLRKLEEEEKLNNSQVVRLLIESGLAGRSSEDVLAKSIDAVKEEYSGGEEYILERAVKILEESYRGEDSPRVSQATL